MLSWLSTEREARIERSQVVRGSDIVDVWVDAPAYGLEQLPIPDPLGETAPPAGETAAAATGASRLVVEASANGIDLQHPWPATAPVEDRSCCVPADGAEPKGIAAFVHARTGHASGRLEVPGRGSGNACRSYSAREIVEWSGADLPDADATDLDAGTRSFNQ